MKVVVEELHEMRRRIRGVVERATNARDFPGAISLEAKCAQQQGRGEQEPETVPLE